MVINTCNSSAQAKIGGSQIQGQPMLNSEILVSMGYYIVRSFVKKKTIKNQAMKNRLLIPTSEQFQGLGKIILSRSWVAQWTNK